jgi:cholesterol transport system auxiliary component
MVTQRLLAYGLAALVSAAILAGCTGVLPRAPESPPKTYLLAPELPPRDRGLRKQEGGEPTLLVSQPEAAAGYGTRRMAYLEQDYRLDQFADHEWVESPSAMLRPLLVTALRGNSAFGAVSEDAPGISADLRLDTLIEVLHQDFRSRPSLARVELRVRIVDPNERRVLATRVFSDTEIAPSDDAYGGVVAVNRILTRLLPQIADFAAETAAGLEGRAPATQSVP